MLPYAWLSSHISSFATGSTSMGEGWPGGPGWPPSAVAAGCSAACCGASEGAAAGPASGHPGMEGATARPAALGPPNGPL